MSNKEYRKKAELLTKENMGILALVYLINMIIIDAIGYYSYGIVTIVVGGPLALGIAAICKKLFNKEKISISDMFTGFNNILNGFVLELLMTIFVTLWSLLFLIPGIIAAINYSMSYFIMNDHPEMSPMEVLKESKRIMYGHKAEYFSLMLSYLGWIILCVLTAGLLLLIVEPRINMARYLFYLHITGQDKKETVLE